MRFLNPPESRQRNSADENVTCNKCKMTTNLKPIFRQISSGKTITFIMILPVTACSELPVYKNLI